MISDPAPIPIEELSSQYALGAWRNCRPLARTLNEHVRVTTDLGEVVVRRSRAEKTMADLRFEVELIDHVRAAGVPGPSFVRTRDEIGGVEIAGSLYSVTWFVHGSAGRSDDPRHLPAMARMQARYHGAVRGFLPRAPSRARPSLLEQLDALAEKVSDLGDTDLSTALAHGVAAADRIRSGDILPTLVIQGGMERGSTLFEGGEIVAGARSRQRLLRFTHHRHRRYGSEPRAGSDQPRGRRTDRIRTGLGGALRRELPHGGFAHRQRDPVSPRAPVCRAIGEDHPALETYPVEHCATS